MTVRVLLVVVFVLGLGCARVPVCYYLHPIEDCLAGTHDREGR